jgi:FtsH-binding integral membrane protein
MVTSTKLKIWTIVTHGFIIIGGGHGIGCLFIIELMGIWSGFNSILNSEKWLFNLVGILTLIGQFCIVISISKRGKLFQKIFFHISGLVLLCISVVLFWCAANRDSYTAVLLPTTIPFFICTVITFFGKVMNRFRENFIDHIP